MNDKTKPEAQVAWKVLQIGNYGAAYDSPNARRAFTYEHQPGNVLASRLGSAATAAVAASAGDSIDRGLSLLKSLQDEGFGVFQVDVAALSTPASHGAQQPEAAGALAGEGDGLPPMPTMPWLGFDPERGDLHGFSWGDMRAYARAALAATPAPAQQPAVAGDAIRSCRQWIEANRGTSLCAGGFESGMHYACIMIEGSLTPAATPGDGHPTDARYEVPPCLECGAISAEDAETKCNCSGDKDDCHGCYLWDDTAQKEGNGNG